MDLKVQELVMMADELREAILIYLENTKQEHKGLLESMDEVESLIKELE